MHFTLREKRTERGIKFGKFSTEGADEHKLGGNKGELVNTV